jgi:hypothetical protein
MIKKLLMIMLIPVSLILMGSLGYNGIGFVATPNTELSECSVQSTSATFVTCFSATLPDNSAYVLKTDCTGIRSDNAEFGAIEQQALVKRTTGTASIEGSVITHFDQAGGAGWAGDIDVSTNDVIVELNSPAETVNWTCFVQMVKKL